MKIEYGKVIESFYWACKANKQTICNDAKPNEVLASVKDASCKAWKLKLSGKESADPTHLYSRRTGSTTESLGCGFVQNTR